MLQRLPSVPLLSIGIPAYNRPHWLERAILSILTTPAKQQTKIEIIVSDDSTISACRQITHKLLTDWKGSWQYCKNTPSLGMAGNWNHCIQLAKGNYVMLLHDDDYLARGAAGKILTTLQQYSDTKAFLFGVNVVTKEQKIRKQQLFTSQQYLNPETALQEVLTNSSFIRFPGIVIDRQIFQTIGYFDTTVGGIADIHMWVRICQAYGILCVPVTTANYTVHSSALTMNMFNGAVLKELEKLFETVQHQHWLSVKVLERCKVNYFNQFILAGTVRHLRTWNFRKAKEVFHLFQQINLQDKNYLKPKLKIIKSCLELFLRLYST